MCGALARSSTLRMSSLVTPTGMVSGAWSSVMDLSVSVKLIMVGPFVDRSVWFGDCDSIAVLSASQVCHIWRCARRAPSVQACQPGTRTPVSSGLASSSGLHELDLKGVVVHDGLETAPVFLGHALRGAVLAIADLVRPGPDGLLGHAVILDGKPLARGLGDLPQRLRPVDGRRGCVYGCEFHADSFAS